MKLLWRRIKIFAIPLICVLFVFLLLWANGRISIPWHTGTIDSFYDMGTDQVEGVFLLTRSDEGYIYLLQRDTERILDYLFSLQIRSKFWQSDILSIDIDAEIFLHESSNTKLTIRLVSENMIEIDSHIYTVIDGVDFEYIQICFDGAEEFSF